MTKILALLIFTLPMQAFAGGFMFGGDSAPAGPSVPARIEPPSPTRQKTKPVKAAPQPAAADVETEATVCQTCAAVPIPRPRPKDLRIDPAHIAGTTTENRAPASTGNACLRKAILEAAQNNVRRRYGNRPYSAGMCAQGVRLSLNASGVIRSGGMGDAVSWHLSGALRHQGFENIINKGFTAANAPPGAVLIFRGPATDMTRVNGGLPSRRARRGRGAGNWVGHVTIKGERPGRYYTDGRTEAPAIARRTLVAVYVPVKCVNCRGAAAKCGAD
jgi:hypothetical protein